MIPTVEMVVKGLCIQDYIELGGSDVFRILVNNKSGQQIKVYYNNYENPPII